MKQATMDTPFFMAIDPGATSGWAIWDMKYGFSSGEVEGRHAFYEFLRLVLGEGRRLRIIGERFNVEGPTGELDALYILGALDYLCDVNNIGLDLSNRDAKTFSTDEKLVALEWYKPGEGHANDASRHLLRHLVKEGGPVGRAIATTLVGGGLA